MKIQLILIFLFFNLLSKSQGLIKDLKYDQHGFSFLFYTDDNNCEGRGSNFYQLNYYGTNNPIRSNQTNYDNQDYFTRILNYITDSVFISNNDIATPEITDIATQLECNSDSSICIIDTFFTQYSNTFNFYYLDHILDKQNMAIYGLFTHTKSAGNSYGYTQKIISNYILKTKLNNYFNNNLYYDSIIAYYKIPLNKNYKLFQKDENSIILFEQDDYLTTNEMSNLKFFMKEFDDNLHLQDSIFLNHSLFGDTISNFLEYDIKKIQDKIYLTAQFVYYPYSYPDLRPEYNIYIWKYDINFNLLDSSKFIKLYEKDNYFKKEAGEHFFFYINDTNTNVRVTNLQNDTIHSITLPTKNKILITNDSAFLILQLEPTSDSYYNYTPVLYKWNLNGTLIKRFRLEDLPSFYGIWKNDDKNLFYEIDSFNNIAYGYYQYESAGCTHGYFTTYNLFNLDEINFVSGKITQEIIQNCAKDTLEPPVKNILVEMQLNGNTFYTYSDEAGKYRFASNDTGHAKVILHLSNQTAFTSACQDTFNVLVSDTLENPVVNFFLLTPVCNRPVPKVSIDITTPFLRRCFDNIYTLTLFNESADTAFNTYADITLDEDLIPVDTAFLSAQNLGNNTYRFTFGDLLPLQTIRQQLVINVNCDDATPGETHCVKAVSYPYEKCLITDGKYMQAQAICRNDSVIFTIRNIGIPENFSQTYRVLVNDFVKYEGNLTFTVSSPALTLSFYNPAGNTYRLETCQYPKYANEDTILSVATEGCNNTGFTTGYITMFAQDDDQPNVSIDCHQNVGSYDPNDKSGSPVGYGAAHLVENTETIEYTIHFQNLGTYAASFVTVIDTLSPDFDVTTLKVTGASHPYLISIIDSNILKFYFPDINLVDAATDSLLSNGFIKFSIQPKSNVAIGNSLKNNAFIIFDYNEAVETNTVQHEIGKDFLKVNIISVIKNNRFNDIEVKVYPNPASKQFTFELSKQVTENVTITVFTIDGKEIYKSSNLSLQTIIHTEKWPANLYLFELKNQTELLQSGKIIIE